MAQINNILITSAGRRVSLVRNAKESLQKHNKAAKVYAVDLKPELSSACQVADFCESVPRVLDEKYIPHLLEFCKKNSISIIIPTIDTELEVLSKSRSMFDSIGVMVAISSQEVCKTFYHKSTTDTFFTKYGVSTPKMVTDFENVTYPLFAKLNNSSCSVGAQKVYSEGEVKELLKENSTYIFQEFIDADEFTVDVYVNRIGEVCSVVPRQRLEVRAGEVNKALAVKDKTIIDAVKDLCVKMNGAFGVITVQLFKKDDKILFIEVNPRFGGGYPLSWRAGADMVGMLIDDYLGNELSYSETWADRTLMLRYDDEVIVSGYSS